MPIQTRDTKYKTVAKSLDDVIKCTEKSDKYKQFCIEQLTDCDRALSDLDHKLELERLDAIKMTEVVAKRKTILQHRRFYKDEIELTSALHIESENIVNTLRSLKHQLDDTYKRLNNRQYTPRILTELFDNYNEETVDESDPLKSFQSDLQIITGRGRNLSKKQRQLEKKISNMRKAN